jgi:phosphoadenosine phosphosulfate reductase
MKTLFGKLDEIAIKRLKTFESNALAKRPEGYYVAYSGGKDSDVVLDLVRRSGVKYTAHYNVTTCDPPEVIRHIAKKSDVKFEKPSCTMWQLIKYKHGPPRRNMRFCCEILKERGGSNSIVVTGIRWQESTRRAKRLMTEICFRDQTKIFLNIIIDWTTTDVWEYIRKNQIEYCSLYDEGFKRLGCVLCPMSNDVERQIMRWPKIAKLWEKSIKKSYRAVIGGHPNQFRSPDELWQWWLKRKKSGRNEPEQFMFFTD